jgi:hypothetical protein
MRNIFEMDIIQIDVTNICDKSCANCTRFCGHYRPEKTYFMDVAYYEKAVISLKDFPGIIGMIGGEPTLHPRFIELCEILNFHVKEKERRGLWSNKGKKFHEYKEIIDKTFGHFNLNDHISHDIFHTPILVASEDMIKDGCLTEEEWRKYTDNCWVQTTWSATITPKGSWFCEVAGMLDCLFEGDKSWDIDKDPEWWKKQVPEYAEQIAWACRKCGCQLPLRPRRSSEGIDDVSQSNLERLIAVGSPKIKNGKFELFTEGLDPDQIRNVAWYIHHRNSIIDKFRRLCTRLLGKK